MQRIYCKMREKNIPKHINCSNCKMVDGEHEVHKTKTKNKNRISVIILLRLCSVIHLLFLFYMEKKAVIIHAYM